MTCAALQIHVDDELSIVFDDALRSSVNVVAEPSVTTEAYCNTPISSRQTRGRGPAIIRRDLLAAAQTILLCESLGPSGPTSSCHESQAQGLGDMTTRFSEQTIESLFVLLETHQVAALLRKVSASQPDGVGPYLDHICRAVLTDVRKGQSPCDKTSVVSAGTRTLKVNIIVAPNVRRSSTPQLNAARDTPQSASPWGYSNSSCGRTGGRRGISASELTRLMSAVVIWGESQGRLSVTLANDTQFRVEVGLCAAAADAADAAQMVCTWVHKVLHKMEELNSRTPASQINGRASKPPAVVPSIRPDVKRKCDSSDFQRLYTSMLTEVSSCSHRRAFVVQAAFPTVYDLLSTIDTHIIQSSHNTLAAKHTSSTSPYEPVTDNTAATTSFLFPRLYANIHGDNRSWNVLSPSLVNAFITEHQLSDTTTP